MPFARIAFFAVLAASILPSDSFAQKKSSGPVYTDLSQVPEDYWIQGEYTGYVKATASSTTQSRVGLQVISLGNNEFEALYLAGGLPGDGWDKVNKTRISGLQFEKTATFETETINISVGDFQAEIRDAKGNLLGTLQRYKRMSPTLNLPAPADAVVLFNGTNADKWKNGLISADGFLQENTETKDAYGDFRLHLEFRLPYKPNGRGQDRGNSGLYIQSRYEVQVLDSFGLDLQFNDCASLYRTKAPDFNMSLPPLTWQTYDIWFKSAKFDEQGNKTENVRITVMLNGVKVHDDFELPRKTGAGKPEGPMALATKLQGHGNPVRFRNIWLIEGEHEPPGVSVLAASSTTSGNVKTTTTATTSSYGTVASDAGVVYDSGCSTCGSASSYDYNGYYHGGDYVDGYPYGYGGGSTDGTYIAPLWSRNSAGIYGGLWPDFTYDNSHLWYVYP